MAVCQNINNIDPCDDGDICTENDSCSEGSCSEVPLDEDNDGYVSDSCNGYDCDDAVPAVYPAAPELCDGIDNQCPGDVGYGDVDETHDGMEDLDGIQR